MGAWSKTSEWHGFEVAEFGGWEGFAGAGVIGVASTKPEPVRIRALRFRRRIKTTCATVANPYNCHAPP